MPDVHSMLGPSSAERWLMCTPSARLCEGLPDTGSDYAREGTLAHRLGELRLRERWEGADVAAEIAEIKASPMYNASMWEHISAYVDFIDERMADARSRCPDPRLFIEQQVRYDDYVPEGFGTSDACIIADDVLDVIDLKYGSGVPVSAEGNPQMRLYGLGCYLAFAFAYDIRTIRMTLFQPRLDSISTDTIRRQELLQWAEAELRPKAALAWAGEGDFVPGEKQCRWCRAAATCRARAEYQLELAIYEFTDPALLTPDDVGEILGRLPDFLSWADQVKAYALDAAVNHGERIPGFKVVEGRSNRKYADEPAIAAALRKAGYGAGDIYKPKELLGITAMEKLVGKKRFADLAGSYIIKPAGAPVLVREDDKRPELNTAAKAAEDFTEE